MPGIGIGLPPIARGSGGLSWGILYWATLTSGLIVYRKGTRSGMYVIDKSEDGGITWELGLVRLELDEDSIIISIDDGVEGYRHVIRDEAYCIDHELDATGFDGTEGVNWENVYNTNTI